jgi:cystathionine gamma-lyase
MHDATKVIHAGHPRPGQGEPFHAGPMFVAPFRLAGDPASSAYQYGRHGNPTWKAFEEAIGAIEGGEAVVFASGMAATSALLGCTLSAGDALVMPTDSYYTTRMLVQQHFAPSLRIEVRNVPTSGGRQVDLLQGAKLLWLESPSNPELDVCDLRLLASAARERGVMVAVDNTTATCLGQKPLSLGADFSLASDTKALTGHSDIILGHVASRDPGWAQRLRAWRSSHGSIPGPMEVWLAHRSLATLDVRLERICSNARDIAHWLGKHDLVRRVRYPGLPTDPAHEIASRQMIRFGPVVSFELPDEPTAQRFLSACRLIIEASSFGGLHTTAERRARWGGDSVAPGFIRLSAGCEHIDDVIADLEQALAVAAA